MVSEKEVVAKDQAYRAFVDELLADDKRLSDARGSRLHGILDGQSELLAVAEQILNERHVPWRANDEDFADSREHQYRQRIVDHRFVVNRKQLLAHVLRQGIQPGAASPRKDDAFHCRLLSESM